MMRLVRLMLREMGYRWPTTLALLLVIAAGTAVCMVLIAGLSGLNAETRRVTRDLGLNLRIISAEADMGQYLLEGFATHPLPKSAIDKLARHPQLSMNHLVAMLHQPVTLGGRPAILTGISEEIYPPGAKKTSMVPPVRPGAAHVGHEIARHLSLSVGDRLEISGRDWEVARCAPQAGTTDDLRVTVPLHEAQAALGRPGEISEIQAIDCLCVTAEEGPQATLEAQVRTAVPEARVVLKQSLAEGRARQRQLVEKLTRFFIPSVLLATTLIVSAIMFVNVRERQSEVGLLRALGYGSLSISQLILGKALLLGLAGGVLGAGLGIALLQELGPRVFQLTARQLAPDWWLAGRLLLASAGLSCLAAMLPMAVAVTREPTAVLRHG